MFRTRNHERKAPVAGPIAGGAVAELKAPSQPDTYVLLVYATDGNGKASSHQLPFRVQ
jgi:hypothetical protein